VGSARVERNTDRLVNSSGCGPARFGDCFCGSEWIVRSPEVIHLDEKSPTRAYGSSG